MRRATGKGRGKGKQDKQERDRREEEKREEERREEERREKEKEREREDRDSDVDEEAQAEDDDDDDDERACATGQRGRSTSYTFGAEDEERLVDFFRAHPCFYDKGDTKYANLTHRRKLLLAQAAELHTTSKYKEIENPNVMKMSCNNPLLKIALVFCHFYFLPMYSLLYADTIKSRRMQITYNDYLQV